MAVRRKPAEPSPKKRPPAKTPEAQESRLVSLAFTLAEKQLEEGTASTPLINHFLKLGASREALEQERLRNENLLLQAKIASIESSARVEAMFEDAISAFRGYQTGQMPGEPYDD